MKTAIIIGAGPAGLTAAYELLTRTDIIPIIIDMEEAVGGLSRTINYKGNRMDIGGHRFFSKSEKIINWWLHFLPLESDSADHSIRIQYQHKTAAFDLDEDLLGKGDKVMMIRSRRSRIYYRKHFFDYPLTLNARTIQNLGIMKSLGIGASYCRAKLFPVRPESSLEDFFHNRFGRKLYETFFRDYTEKVWGVPCERIPASWGHQRVKDLNITKMISHAVRNLFRSDTSIRQKSTSTSLIEQFLYPKLGPGQMWETVAEEVRRLGGKIYLNTSAEGIEIDGANRVVGVRALHTVSGNTMNLAGDYVFSTMPVKQLVQKMNGAPVPDEVKEVAAGLEYRDFLIVGILVTELKVAGQDKGPWNDNWIYIQDKLVRAGRVQFFNNWSPFMVNDASRFWLGVEYFCSEEDALWAMDDEAIKKMAIGEMELIGILDASAVLDALVVKVKKAYPSYYGSYDRFEVVQQFLDGFENLFMVGRNGMHRYNNSDHSMLTAMAAVENILKGRSDKLNIWEINTEIEYLEESGTGKEAD